MHRVHCTYKAKTLGLVDRSNHSVTFAMLCKEQLDVWNFINHSSNTTILTSCRKCIGKTIYGIVCSDFCSIKTKLYQQIPYK
uniref:Uncharacterized protein n=1 Tax=Arundo donax TaxID=35708 RepID=A0A0A9HVJ6_ARUDO